MNNDAVLLFYAFVILKYIYFYTKYIMSQFSLNPAADFNFIFNALVKS